MSPMHGSIGRRESTAERPSRLVQGTVTETVHEQLRAIASRERRSCRAVVSEAVERYVAAAGKAARETHEQGRTRTETAADGDG